MNRIRGQPRRDGFPARFIQDMAATAGVAVGHQVARSGATTTAPRRRALTVPRLLPRCHGHNEPKHRDDCCGHGHRHDCC